MFKLNSDDIEAIRSCKITEMDLINNLINALRREEKDPTPRYYLNDIMPLRIHFGADLSEKDTVLMFKTKNHLTKRPVKVGSDGILNDFINPSDFKESGTGYIQLEYKDDESLGRSPVTTVEIRKPF